MENEETERRRRGVKERQGEEELEVKKKKVTRK